MLSVGPLTITVPSFISMLPLLSSPSPLAFTTSVPPLMVKSPAPSAVDVKVLSPGRPLTAEASFPPAALMPSSEVVKAMSPPFSVISVASMPS